MRIIFIGAVEFSLRALEKLVALNANIVGVCSARDPNINSDYVDLCEYSRKLNLASLHIDDINSEGTLNWIRERSPDIIFCLGWSRLIKQALLDIPAMGVIGYHPSLLPQNRGRHPIIWSLALGLKKTGSTFFLMDLAADSGDIISQRSIDINDDDDARSLYDKIINVALSQLEELLNQLSSRAIKRIKQNNSVSNEWRKRTILDGKIDWRMSADVIYNLIRALSKPYPGAYFLIGTDSVIVWKSAIVFNVEDNIEPGKVISQHDNTVVIKCGKDALSLLITEPNLKNIAGAYL